MSVSEQDVCEVARLSRIKLSTEEISYFQAQLSKIISYVDELKELEKLCEKISDEDLLCQKAEERDDIVEPYNELDLVLNNAPQTAGSSFQLPRIIEG